MEEIIFVGWYCLPRVVLRKTALLGLLNISLQGPLKAYDRTEILSWRECSKRPLSDPPNPSAPRRALPRVRPQPFPVFVAHFGGVGLTRGAYPQYVSANAAKSGKSVSPKVRQKGDLPTRSRYGRHGTAGLAAVALAKAGGFFQHSQYDESGARGCLTSFRK